ncbi:MAG: metallophosphoesterase [Eubacteriales bacterium]|nr:metallophosphoesterase [Eubacteriales bacterium]
MHPTVVIAGILFIAVLFLFRSRWEKKQLRTEYYHIRTDKLDTTVRVVFLSDLHSKSFGDDNRELIIEISKLNPDLIVIGGDMITCGKNTAIPPKTKTCIDLIESLSEKWFVYYAEGNHEARFRERFPDDYAIFTTHLDQLSNVEYLSNAHVTFDCEDRVEDAYDDLYIYGASLDKEYFRPLKPGFGRKKEMPYDYLSAKLGKCNPDRFNILMLHTPMYFEQAVNWGADLVLSGHFHGGTVRLPFVGGLMTPQLQFFVKECAGEFELKGSKLIVNRGLGTHSIKIRINDLPEISCIDIEGRI